MRTPSWISRHLAALRALVVLTVLTGIGYPLAVWTVAQLPGLSGKADGSVVRAGGTTVGSSLIGQSFTDDKGNPITWYFQSRPSAAGAGYDPTSTSASNLGPESVVDTAGHPSLLTQVCARSLAVGQTEGVDGSRPYCTADGVGAVLVVVRAGGVAHGKVTAAYAVNQACPAVPFIPSYDGVAVRCARAGTDYTALGFVTPIRGDAPAHPRVPADAVTASGSGLDPDISPAYAELQAPRVAAARGVDVAVVRALIAAYTDGRGLGFMGEPAVNVLELNLALDARYPHRS